MALQIGPSPTAGNPSVLGGVSDIRTGLRNLQAAQPGIASQIQTGTASAPAFGKEFMVLLEAKEQAKAQSDMEAMLQSLGKAPEGKGAASGDSLVTIGKEADAASKLLAQSLAKTEDDEKLVRSATASEIVAGHTLAAQILASQMAPQAPIHSAHAASEGGPETTGDGKSLETKTPAAATAKAQLSAQTDWKLSVPNTVLDSQGALVPGARTSGQAGASTVTARTAAANGFFPAVAPEALMAQGMIQVPDGEELEFEADSPRMSREPMPRSGVSTMDHVSGKDFLQAFNMSRSAVVPAAPSSLLSKGDSATAQQAVQPGFAGVTTDLLKNPEFGKSKGETDVLRDAPLTAAHPLNTHGAAHFPETATSVAANVTQGASAQARISSESLNGIAQTVQNMQQMQQMGTKGLDQGQMRIRLKPDSLGEIHLKVATHGNQVELQVQASDENAKKILQSSLSDLRDHLASKNLTLGSVDFGVFQNGSSPGGHESFASDHGMNQQNQPNPWSGNLNDGSSGQTRQERPELLGMGDDRVVRPLPRAFSADQAARTAAASGRLDVMA